MAKPQTPDTKHCDAAATSSTAGSDPGSPPSPSAFPSASTFPRAASFAGTSAVVTGASSGIGRATAVELARSGVSGLVIHYRKNRQGAEETAQQAREAGKGSPDPELEIELVQADLAKLDDSTRLVDSSFDRFDNLQTWINNAGGDVLTGSLAEADFQTKLDYLWNIDVRCTITLSREVAKRFQAQSVALHPPSLVFIGWDQAPRGMEGDAGQMFGPIKAAVMAFANSLAQEVAPTVRVNTVAPGWTETSWGKQASDYWNRRAEGQSLMGRWGNPRDIAAAIVYAANPHHTFVTGQTLEVNGGWNRRFQ